MPLIVCAHAIHQSLICNDHLKVLIPIRLKTSQMFLKTIKVSSENISFLSATTHLLNTANVRICPLQTPSGWSDVVSR
jgi:hypothetical protein